MSADDGLAAESEGRDKPGPDAEAQEMASDWLHSALTAGPRLAKDLLDEWRNGQGGSERTLKRAKQSLVGVEAYRVDVPGPWWWRLPSKDAKASQIAELGPLGTLGKNTGFQANPDALAPKDTKLDDPGILGNGAKTCEAVRQ